MHHNFYCKLASTTTPSTRAVFDTAFAYLDQQEKLNYSEAARKFKLDRMTLQRRYTGKAGSRQEENSKYRQLLNDVEEDTLLRYVDGLTNRRISPTHQIVRNLAEEILGGPIGDHWPKRFVKRHQSRVCSVYLKPIGHSRAFLNLLLFSNATMQLYCFRVVIASIAKFCATWPKQLRPTTLLPNVSTIGIRRASLEAEGVKRRGI